jgi:hypothetical protein
MPLTILECQVSELVNSDACPRPTTGPGDPSFDRFEFLVADYKPAFFYWDTVEMLRKVRGST